MHGTPHAVAYDEQAERHKHMTMPKIWMILSAFVGAGAALATTAALQILKNDNQYTTRTRPDKISRHTHTSKSVTAEISPRRLNALESEIARLRSERNDRGQAESTPPMEELDPQAERERVTAWFSELERRLLADPVDPSWSRAATEFLRSDLSTTAAKAGFHLVAAECRTEMCRATLRWDNYEAARKTGAQLAERAIPGLNCTRSIWLKEPDSPSQPYLSDLFLDCTEQRMGNVDTIPLSAMNTGDTP